MSLPGDPRTWVRDGFLISTDKTLLSIPSINSAFQQEFMYWTSAVPDDILQEVVNNSFCFGLYKSSHANPTTPESCSTASLDQIGFARLITDNVTFAYLTDLYVVPEHQGLGLGGWLIDCVDELLEPLPYLRWAMLRTSVQKSEKSYQKRLGMTVLKSGEISEGPVMMGKKGKAGKA